MHACVLQYLQAIRGDYASVLASREIIERSENELEAKHEHRREMEAKASVFNEEKQQISHQVDVLTYTVYSRNMRGSL